MLGAADSRTNKNRSRLCPSGVSWAEGISLCPGPVDREQDRSESLKEDQGHQSRERKQEVSKMWLGVHRVFVLKIVGSH